jgi:murein DD-endopeptidase MepM/ murein hydrolase activator NlpD
VGELPDGRIGRVVMLGVFSALAVLLVCAVAWLEPPFEGGPLAVVRRPLRALAELPSVRRDVLGQGETLEKLTGRLGLSSRELSSWVAAAQPLLNVRALPVGLQAEATVGADGTVRSLRLTPDWRADIVLERADGGIRARREERPVDRQVVVVRGSIESSLFGAVGAAGETDDLATALADLFQWDIDFHRDVQPQDSFAVLVERVRASGVTVAYGPIMAATFTNQGKVFAAYRYAVAGVPGHYDAKGSPTRKLFLRAPLRFTRVTSGFSRSRLHPILGVRTPHWGVDYGAPVGTPVMATATGTVVLAGWKGGGGNTVELRHPGGFTTAYLHLSRFASGIRAGARVEQGQVVGFVGTTGMSTGPHLDYRVTKNGSPLNPATVGREPAPPLPAAELEKFQAWRAQLDPLLGVAGAVTPSTWAAVLKSAPTGAGV